MRQHVITGPEQRGSHWITESQYRVYSYWDVAAELEYLFPLVYFQQNQCTSVFRKNSKTRRKLTSDLLNGSLECSFDKGDQNTVTLKSAQELKRTTKKRML